MRRQLRILSLLVAFLALFQAQKVQGQSQNVLYQPGITGANALSVPALSSKITGYPFTIEMWVKPNSITPYGGFFYDKSGTKTCLQYANATTGELRFDLFGGANTVTLSAAKKLSIGKWQHLAVTVYKDSAVVEIDGSFYTAAHTKTFASFCTTASTIGMDVDVNSRIFNGSIDDIRFWKSARSRSEITAYKDSILNPAAQADLVAYYNFNDLTANDATSNALNATKAASASYCNLVTEAKLSNPAVSVGLLTPQFHPDSLNYTFYAPPGTVMTAIPVGDGTTVTGSPATPTIGSPNFTMTATSKDGLANRTYTFNTQFMPFSAWDADGRTGNGSEPNYWGWSISDVPWAWGQAGGSNNRYVDITTTGWNYNNGTTTSAWTGRLLYIRWDGTGGTTLNSLYSYPMYLEGCKTYELNTKYSWVNNSTVPTATMTISKDKLATQPILTESAVCSSTKQLFLNKKMVFSPSTSGIYYFTCKANTASLMALADMSLAESTTPGVNSSLSTVAFTDASKSFKFTITGIALTDTIKLSAPAGITLSKTIIMASEAPCGVEVTATNNYGTPLTSGNITLTSGAVTKLVAFTYTKPSVSIYEQDVEVENNGKAYPLNVTSVNNTVDSLYVVASAGLTLAKSSFSNADFVAGGGSVKVNVSSAVAGTTGTLTFSSKSNVAASNLDTVNVTAVAPYARVYIKHKPSGMVIGNQTTGLYPALTTAQGLVSQKFILKRTAPLSLTDTTIYLLQDTAYRAVKKVASSNWDTEYGLPSADAKWTIQQKGNGVITLTNATTNKVLGTDAPVVNGRMYDDKAWTAGGNMEWIVTQIPVVNVSSKILSAFTSYPGSSSTKTIKIGGSNLGNNIKLTLSGAGASQFKVSYDTLVPATGTVADSTLTITYTPSDWGTHVAKLNISTALLADVVIDLQGLTVKDVTSLITNSTIEGTSNTVLPNGWTITKNTGNYSGTGQHYSGVTSNRYLDSWNGTVGFLIYNAQQTIKKIPNGIYTMTAAGRSSGSKAYMFANDKQTEIINNADAGGLLGKGWNPISVEKVAVLDSTITIGAKTVTGWTGTWFSADDFTLQYFGTGDYAAYKPVLDSLVAKSERFDLTTSPNGEDTNLAAAISTAKAASDVNTVLAAFTGLKKQFDLNTASVANYLKLKNLIASATTLSNTTSYNATGLTTFKAAITAADGVYNAGTTMTADVNTAITTLNKAQNDYKALQPAPADFTFVLANPGFEEGTVTGIDPTSIKKTGNFNTPIGWNVWAKIDTLAPAANFVGLSSSTTMAEGTKGFETWVQGTYSKAINVSQKVVIPASGFYTLSASLRCDASSPSLTDPLKFDAQVYAKVGNADEVKSIKLAEAVGLITSTGWNTKAAWRTVPVYFKANAGDTVKLGVQSTSFMQMDNFTLAYKGNNNPATIDVAYITRSKVMDAAADSVMNDPVYRLLSRDPKLNVTLKALTDVSATATFDQSPYDALIVQEALGGGDAILMPSGALALSKLTVPTIYNKSYAFRAGRALATGATGSGAEAPVGTFAFKVDTAKWTNPLFKGITIVGDTVQLFTKPAQDNGAVPTAVTTTMKALNYSTPVVGLEGTQLAYLKGTTSAVTTLFMNDIVAPDTIGGQPIKTRVITFGMNYGAQCRDHGANMTQANYTLWRNAVYSLVGLEIPNTPAAIPAVVNVSASTVPAMTANVGNFASNTIKVGGYNLAEKIRVSLSGAGAAHFKLSFDTLAAVSRIAKDSVLTIKYQPTDAGSHTASLTISSLNAPTYVIALSGTSKKDMTSLIVNPGIDAANNDVVPNGWSVTKNTGGTTNTGQHYSLVTSNRYLDSWNGTQGFLLYNAQQTIKGIPNGSYTVTSAARTSGLGSFIFANDKQTEIINNAGTGGTLGNGFSTITVDKIAVLDSSITIGAKTTVGWTGYWFSADDFTLTYNGPGEFADYKIVLDSLIAKAQRFDQNTSPNGLDALLGTAITTGQAASDLNGVLTAYAGLKKALNNNIASAPAYGKLSSLIASSTTLSNTTSYTGVATFKTAITAAETVYNGAATLPIQVDSAIMNLNKALYTYKIAQPAPANFTFVMANPGFEEGTVAGIDPASVKKSGGFNSPIGWKVYAVIDTLAPWANFVGLNGADMAEGTRGFETWVQGGYNKSISISQKVIAPATGYYILTANARCDGSSPSLTDPKLYDAHLFAKVASKPEVDSKKLAEIAGLNTGSGWNSKAAWRTLNLIFTATAGDTLNLGIASTSFMQVDNFTLGYRGNNNPATIDIAYITKVKTMDVNADSVQNDPVYRMLSKDSLLTVTLKAITDVSATATFDQTPYDAIIIQESMGGGDAILFPANALGLPKLSVPTLYNKTYAFKAGRALASGALGAGAEATVGTFSLKVDSINKTNALFRGLTFTADTVQMFTKPAQDNGAVPTAVTTTMKALNVTNGLVGAEGTLLAYPNGMSTAAICVNDILPGDTIGGQPIKTRLITFGMNFGAMCRDHGQNMTNANYTLWRNAVYSLVGLPVPSTPLNIVTEIAKPAESNGMNVVVYPNPTTSNVNISNLNLNATVKIFNMTGQMVFNGKADSETMSVDMSRYSNGIYMLQVVSNGKAQKSKIVKK